ncbi:MAG: hypothetical protein SOZ62_04985 [Eubacteriales bacterium]|nr:hypothetical protein [Eubacteriales bacterium]
MDLPTAFLDRMKNLLGDLFPDFLAASEKKAVRGLRVNPLKMNCDTFERVVGFGCDKIPYVHGGYTFDFDGIGRSPLHHSGAIYVQEPAAMAVMESLDIGADFNVLDMCASPGGKSMQAASKNTNGIIVSNEYVGARAQILLQNAERLGLRNSIITSLDSRDIADFYPDTFDLTVVDAPCSGEGMMRKSETAVSEWSEDNVRNCAERQKYILDNAAKTVKRGGFLLYSTCTYSLEENEMTVDAFLCEHREFSIIDVNRKVKEYSSDGIEFDGCKSKDIRKCRRFYAGINAGEGQFIALMSKDSDVGNVQPPKKNTYCNKGEQRILNVAREFIEENTVSFDFDRFLLSIRSDGIYIAPRFEVMRAGVVSLGVKLGEERKGRIIPHHRFFMAFGSDFIRKVDLADGKVFGEGAAQKYIHGDTLPFDGEDGFYAVTWNGATLGGGKASGGVMKNHYPKGLRNP